MTLRSGRTLLAHDATWQRVSKEIRKLTYWLGGAFYLNEAHAAVAGHGESFMVAESWNFDASLLTCLENGV